MSSKNTTEKVSDKTGPGDFSKYERKQYSKKDGKMVDNTGKTFGVFEYESFAGDIITPSNRRSFMMMYFADYLQSLVEKGTMQGSDVITDEIRAEAIFAAKERVAMNKKALAAHKKGKQYFRYRGNKMIVPTVNRVAEMKANLEAFQANYSPDDLLGEEE